MTDEDARRARQAENERLLREANLETTLVQGADADADEELLFFCACGREQCDEQLWLSIAEFHAAHREPHRFVVVPGHVTPEIERVVERHATHVVVEKLPAYQGTDPTAR